MDATQITKVSFKILEVLVNYPPYPTLARGGLGQDSARGLAQAWSPEYGAKIAISVINDCRYFPHRMQHWQLCLEELPFNKATISPLMLTDSCSSAQASKW